MNFLTDALGSAIAVTDSGGSINTSYTYEPFGNVTVFGTNSSPYQFTGRENDGTGLYFYRARYYSPTYQRFVSQDPIGFAGGDANLYGYVGGNPISRIDPLGFWQFSIAGGTGYGGQVTFGYNGGQGNFGTYLGVGEGVSITLDPNDSGCHSPGLRSGLRAEGRIGLGPNVEATANTGPDGSSEEVSVHVPGTPVNFGVSTEDPSVHGVQTTFSFGESSFFGVGGTAYFSR